MTQAQDRGSAEQGRRRWPGRAGGARTAPGEAGGYYTVPTRTRALIAASYVAVALFCLWGMNAAYLPHQGLTH